VRSVSCVSGAAAVWGAADGPAPWWRPLSEAAVACVGGGGVASGGGYGSEAQVAPGLGRIVALHHRSSASYPIR
jgi:hypothetical protein